MVAMSRDAFGAAALGFAVGGSAAVALCIARSKVASDDHHLPTKVTNPREWAIWNRLDRKRVGFVTRADVRKLCYRMESDEHADILAEILDPRGRDRITFEDFIAKFPYVQMMRRAGRHKLWHRTCGIGVAGNVAGHMAQAGEASAKEPAQTMPAAIFGYYMPPNAFFVTETHAIKKRLEQFPVTYAVIELPRLPGAMKVQVEPELGLYADIVYSPDKSKVLRLVPRRVAAFNDCSIRVLDGADKLSMKKNWGYGSKGISLRSFPVESLAKGSYVDNLVIVSYLKRDGQTFQYSVPAPCRNYLCFHDELLDWIVKSINEQKNTDKWEDIFSSLKESDYPTSTWIACGAGEYTEWGATNYIQSRDEAVVMVYDERFFPHGPSMEVVENSFLDRPAPDGLVDLHQTFLPPLS